MAISLVSRLLFGMFSFALPVQSSLFNTALEMLQSHGSVGRVGPALTSLWGWQGLDEVVVIADIRPKNGDKGGWMVRTHAAPRPIRRPRALGWRSAWAQLEWTMAQTDDLVSTQEMDNLRQEMVNLQKQAHISALEAKVDGVCCKSNSTLERLQKLERDEIVVIADIRAQLEWAMAQTDDLVSSRGRQELDDLQKKACMSELEAKVDVISCKSGFTLERVQKLESDVSQQALRLNKTVALWASRRDETATCTYMPVPRQLLPLCSAAPAA